MEIWALVAIAFAAVFSVGVSTFAILRTFIPPQQRTVMELRGRLEDVADDNEQIHARLNARAARTNMEKARETKEQRRAVTDDLVAQAEQLAGKQRAPAAPPDPEALRAELRRKHLQ
jgi:hypothetical protein